MIAPILPSRRGFITGLVSFVAAPAIVRAGSLMPVKQMIEPEIRYRAISVDEMVERMLCGPAISAAMTDLMAFGSSVVIFDENGPRHVPLQEFYR